MINHKGEGERIAQNGYKDVTRDLILLYPEKIINQNQIGEIIKKV